MQTANTLQVRAIVRSVIGNKYYCTYTDKVANNNERAICFGVGDKAYSVAEKINKAFKKAGFSNRVHVTDASDNSYWRLGGTYIRTRARWA